MLALMLHVGIIRGLMPRYAENLIGQRFGRLTVESRTGVTSSGNSLWRSRCDCGGFSVATGTNLRRGVTKSCGCYGKEQHSKATTRHGHAPKHGGFSPEYKTWTAMKARCNNPGAKNYPLYGGRGIKVCQRWSDSFADFFADMGNKPPGHTINRINNEGNYEPGNCEWATNRKQSNNRRNNSFIEFDGRRQTITEWAREKNMGDTTLFMRLYKSGWSVERALTTPVKGSP